jgi:hypothetical protein
MNTAGGISRSIVFRAVMFAAFFALAYLLLGPIVCDVMIPGSGKQVVTLAKFNNLRVAMSHLTNDFYTNEEDFPADTAELASHLQEYLRMDDLGDGEPLYKGIRDAWGRELVLEGGLSGYIIRSAGRDGIYDNADDIYLKGNTQSENVFGPASRRKLTARSLRKRFNIFPIHEPTGYYRVSLPGFFTVIREYEGSKSILTFQYTSSDFVRITADADGLSWDPAEWMAAHVEDIAEIRDMQYLGFEVERNGLVDVQGGRGYEIRRSSLDTVIHEFAFYNGYELTVQVLIQSKAKARTAIVDILESEIEENLVMRE